IQSTADAQVMPPTDYDQVLPPTANDTATRDVEIAAVSKSASQNQTENSEPSSEALFRQFQAWAADRSAQAQVAPVQSVQDASARLAENVRVHRHVRPIRNARAEIRQLQNPRKRVWREQKPRVQPAQYSRAQDQSEQNAQAPSFLESFGWRN